MTISIKDPEADKLARKVAKYTGSTITHAVIEALREKLAREERRCGHNKESIVEEVMEIARRSATLPVYDNRSEDEILGYDENGIPT
jgi:antitoxin VapB